MARRDEAQVKDSAAVAVSTGAASAPVASCTCEEFRRDRVCDHVLMAAAVRMVRRMIDVEKDALKPH